VTLSSASAVCSGADLAEKKVLDLLAALVNKSLVLAETLRSGDARYRLLESVRQYALEQLREADEWTELKDRHLDHFLGQTQRADRELRGGHHQQWLNWLEHEYDNIRAALSWSLSRQHIEAGLQICVALYQHWVIRDYVHEGATWLERLLAQADDEVAVSLRVEGLSYATFLAGIRGRTSAQLAYGREAVTLARAAAEVAKPTLALALAAQGFGARARGDHESEFALAQEIVQLWRELGDAYQLGLALSLYTPAAMALGKYDTAREMLAEALPLLQQAGDPYRVAMALNYRGDLARCQGDYQRARTAYEESLAMLQELEAERDLASVKQNLSHTFLHLGHIEQARPLLEESLENHQAHQNLDGLAESILGSAALALVTGRTAVGARLLAAAAKHGGQHVTAEWPATRREYEHYLEQARSELTARRFRQEREAGQRLTLAEAIALARSVARQTAAISQARRQLDELTPREREVAALMAQAKSNTEIAAELVISKRTVETHVSHIYAKLGFNRRTEIVRWAIDSKLVDPEEPGFAK